jgi:hypothetical protein
MCRFLLLDAAHYLLPHPLPLLPDVNSFGLFTNTAEYCIRICIALQEIAHDSPDIVTRGTAPDRGLIKKIGQFIDQGIADRLVSKLVYSAHDDVCLLLVRSSLFILLEPSLY